VVEVLTVLELVHRGCSRLERKEPANQSHAKQLSPLEHPLFARNKAVLWTRWLGWKNQAYAVTIRVGHAFLMSAGREAHQLDGAIALHAHEAETVNGADVPLVEPTEHEHVVEGWDIDECPNDARDDAGYFTTLGLMRQIQKGLEDDLLAQLSFVARQDPAPAQSGGASGAGSSIDSSVFASVDELP
jgi:hypothetical protein